MHTNLFIPSTLNGMPLNVNTGAVDIDTLRSNLNQAADIYIQSVDKCPVKILLSIYSKDQILRTTKICVKSCKSFWKKAKRIGKKWAVKNLSYMPTLLRFSKWEKIITTRNYHHNIYLSLPVAIKRVVHIPFVKKGVFHKKWDGFLVGQLWTRICCLFQTQADR